jgi:hypothetical protein
MDDSLTDDFDIDALQRKAEDIMNNPQTQRDCVDATYEKYKTVATATEMTVLTSPDFLAKMENPFMFEPSDILGNRFVKDVGQAIIEKIRASFTPGEITQLQSVGFPASGGGRKRRKKRKSKKRRSKKRRSRTRRRRR